MDLFVDQSVPRLNEMKGKENEATLVQLKKRSAETRCVEISLDRLPIAIIPLFSCSSLALHTLLAPGARDALWNDSSQLICFLLSLLLRLCSTHFRLLLSNLLLPS